MTSRSNLSHRVNLVSAEVANGSNENFPDQSVNLTFSL